MSESMVGSSGSERPVVSENHLKLMREISLASESFRHEREDEEEGEEEDRQQSLELSLKPLIPLKDQLEMDKDDESLRRWKEQLLGTVPLDHVQGVEPEVKMMSLNIISAGRPDILITFPLQMEGRKSRPLFTLKEGSTYQLQFTFVVKHNIVSGLTYIHTVWKNGIRVDKTKVMFGTFGPQLEPHVHTLEEETTPTGLLARGTYSARTKLLDDDGKCYFKIDYTFDIRKDWH